MSSTATRLLLAFIAALVAVGCGTSEPAVPFHFSVGVSWRDGPDSQVEPKPTLYIDDVVTDQLDVEYASSDEALGQTHVVELRHNDLVVAVRSVRIGGPGSCLAALDGTPTRSSTSLCALPSGDIRYFAETAMAMTADGGTAACVGDGFCLPGCFPARGCDDGTRCTSIYMSVDPIATHLGCAPAGDKALGEACILISDEAGTHDDCGDHLLCVDSTCRQTCSVHDLPSADCAACSYVYGHAPELGVCE